MSRGNKGIDKLERFNRILSIKRKEINMTDSNDIIKVKSRIKERFGDKYDEFMIDFNNIKFTIKQLSEKWNVCQNSLKNWCDRLGNRSFKTKYELRNFYRVQRRVKERQETARQILAVLMRRSV